MDGKAVTSCLTLDVYKRQMYYLLDMTLEEIANELGIEYETVKSTKSKAIKELRKGAASESEEA